MSDVISRAGAKIKPLRHHPAVVALHWSSALLILVAIASGVIWLRETPNSSPDKIVQLRAHVVLGVAILALTVAQLAARVLAARPARATAGNALLDRLALVTHYGLYAAVIVMALSGIATAALSDLPPILFGDAGAPLPRTFDDLAPRKVHGVVAKVVIGLVSLHLLGALYHQVLRRDGLLRRMWFGRR
jgi:cytochrome b561